MKTTLNRLHIKYEKEASIMQAIPPSNDALYSLSHAIDNLRACDDFENLSFPQNEMVQFEYKNIKYRAFIFKDDVKLSLLKVQHPFSDDEILRYKNASTGLTVSMVFTDDFMESFHVQLKLLMTLVPSAIAIADYSALSILSGRWARLQLSSKCDIPMYMGADSLLSRVDTEIYSNKVWIHTHGMKRLIGVELESDSIPNVYESYPEFTIFEKCCEAFLMGRADLRDNSLIHLCDGITLLAEPSTQIYSTDNPEPYQRTRMHAREDNFYLHLLESVDDEVVKHPLSQSRKLHDDILTSLMMPNMTLFKEMALDRLPLLKDYVQGGNTFANISEDGYRWISISSLEDDTFMGVYDDSKDLSPSSFRVDDINNWIVYKGDIPVGPDDAFLLIEDKPQCASLLANHRDKFISMLCKGLKNGESSMVAENLESIDVLDYELLLIYVKALLNMGYYALSRYHLMREVFRGKDDPKWLTLLAAANRMMYQDDKSELLIKRALEVDPNDVHALSESACLNLNREDYSQALDILYSIQKEKDFPSVLSKGEEESIYNMIDYCNYGRDEQDRIQRLRVCQMHLSGGAYRKAISLLNREEEMYPKGRILYAKALLGLNQAENALANLNLVDDEFKDDEWHRTALEVYDSLSSEKIGEIPLQELHNLRAKSQEYNMSLFKEMHGCMISDDRFLGIFTDPQNRLTLMVNLIDSNVLSLLRRFNRAHSDRRLYQMNIGDFMLEYLKEGMEGVVIPSPELDMDYNTLLFRLENTRDNARLMDNIADELFILITKLNPVDVYIELNQKPHLLQHDVKKVYDFKDPEEYDLFRFVVDDMYHAEAFHEQIELFSNQKSLPEDEVFAYVCALNNTLKFEEALSLMTPFKSSHMDDDYFHYIYVYSLIGCGKYDLLDEHLNLKSSFINNIPIDGDEDDLTIKCYCLMAEGNINAVKSTLAGINLEKPKQNFNLKDGLMHLLDSHPYLKDDFYQEMIVTRCENLMHMGKMDDARSLIKENTITNKAAMGRLYHLLVMLDEYHDALRYLNMVDENNRRDYWCYCRTLCQIFTGDYPSALKSIHDIIDYLKAEKKLLTLSPKGNLVYAFACYALGDISSCRLEIITLWENNWSAIKYMNDLLDREYSAGVTPSEVEEFKELREKFL